jgi:hypothetical protein
MSVKTPWSRSTHTDRHIGTDPGGPPDQRRLGPPGAPVLKVAPAGGRAGRAWCRRGDHLSPTAGSDHLSTAMPVPTHKSASYCGSGAAGD